MAGRIVSAGNNLSGDGAVRSSVRPTFAGAGGEIDPRFSSVYDADFFVRLLELQPGSPAIDASWGGVRLDQRALWRPQDGDANGLVGWDIGAYERDGPPLVAYVLPVNNSAGIAPGSNVEVQFHEPMNASSAQGAFAPALREFDSCSWNLPVVGYGASKMVFDPDSPLDLGADYVARVTTAAADVGGFQLRAPLSWRFQIVPGQSCAPVSATVGVVLAGATTRACKRTTTPT